MNEPPSIPLPPMGVRYPLFADEVDAFIPETDLEAPQEAALDAGAGLHETRRMTAVAEAVRSPAPVTAAGSAPATPRRRTPGRIAIAGAAVLLIGIALLGGRLLGALPDHAGHPASPATRPTSSTAASRALVLTASAPKTAPPAVDTAGRPVTYAASNMVDGDPSTAWRTTGDATGMTLSFTLAHPATVTSVGLINGYAKTEGGMDWYAGDRRVLEVRWTFDDGRSVTQTLRDDTRSMQRVAVPRVHTGRVTLTLLQVSDPGTGRARRDLTAISEVQVEG